MCLLLIALDVVAARPLLLLANRDEFHARPSAAATAWPDRPGLIGGRDLEAGGSWLAAHQSGRFAAVTNVRLAVSQRGPRSRGDLVCAFVAGQQSAADFVAELIRHAGDYAPFNLVVADAEQAWCLESSGRATQLEPGIHLVSNGPLDAHWPKMQRLRRRFEDSLATAASDSQWLDLLGDRQLPDDGDLPDTGVGRELERFLAPIFVLGDTYGTRASTLAWRDTAGGVGLRERSFAADGRLLGEVIC